MSGPEGNQPLASREFTTTHWSVVLSAIDAHAPGAPEALAQLCRTYWYPLYAFIRRKGHSPHDAEDLTQEFFHHLLEKSSLERVDRARGRFRSFLLASLEYFLANQWRHDHRLKRGGGNEVISLDAQAAENRYSQEPATQLSPEQIYDQRWAQALLDEVLHHLRREYAAAGKAALFDTLRVFLTGEKRPATYATLAIQLETTEGALKMAVSRLRQRYGELLRAEIARTVSGPGDVEEELRSLHAALGAG